MRLEGKTAVVTGAAGTIGSEVVKRFAAEGAEIVATGRNLKKLDALATKFDLDSKKYLAVSTDITSEQDIIGLMDKAEEHFGKIDILVCCSGISGDINKTADYSTVEFDKVVATNMRGTFLCMKHVIPHMTKNGGGSIVAVSSIGGLCGMPGTIGYNATKFAINGMIMTIATDHSADGIRANSVCPSPVEGEMMRKTEAAYGANAGGVDAKAIHDDISKGIPLGRYAEPSEIANAILFLASDEADFITGVTLPVDGGMASS